MRAGSVPFLLRLIDLFFWCAGSSSLCAGFLLLRRAGSALCCSAWASHCSGFSRCRAQALGFGLCSMRV